MAGSNRRVWLGGLSILAVIALLAVFNWFYTRGQLARAARLLEAIPSPGADDGVLLARVPTDNERLAPIPARVEAALTSTFSFMSENCRRANVSLVKQAVGAILSDEYESASEQWPCWCASGFPRTCDEGATKGLRAYYERRRQLYGWRFRVALNSLPISPAEWLVSRDFPNAPCDPWTAWAVDDKGTRGIGLRDIPQPDVLDQSFTLFAVSGLATPRFSARVKVYHFPERRLLGVFELPVSPKPQAAFVAWASATRSQKCPRSQGGLAGATSVQ